MHLHPILRGKFITVEGIDGAGKSSHIATIQGVLAAAGIESRTTREPGGTAIGEQLRSLVLHHTMQPNTELLLMFAARAEHVASVIEPAMSNGAWVVCDRFSDATMAYQGAGRGIDASLIRQLMHIAHPHLQPDLTFIFDAEVSLAQSRIEGRIQSTREAKDRFESEAQTFATKVRQGYLDIARAEPMRVKVINSAQAFEKVQADVKTQMHLFLSVNNKAASIKI